MNYLLHIKNARSLITTRSEVRAGFVAMALAKNRKAIPYVEEARALKFVASQARRPSTLLEITNIRDALLTAAGLSGKALNYLEEDDKTEAIRGLIEEFLEPAGDEFVDELVYRFLLIRGASLDGSMRNLAGSLAEEKFKRSVIAALSLRQITFSWFSKKSRKWLKDNKLNSDIEDINGLHWETTVPRTIIFNKTVPFIKKNIDICLLETFPKGLQASIKEPGSYIALGELKGGIDPAGADEHWKTARTALERIIEGFKEANHEVETFFIGAAIEVAMAEEIWKWLRNEKLANAGNLTNPNHVAAVCGWLVEL